MKRPNEIMHEVLTTATLSEVTGAFEGIASMKIAQTKNQVLESTRFFDHLWQIYRQLRVDALFRFGRERNAQTRDKELYIIITAEGGFSGDIDIKLIRLMQQTYESDKNDIIVIGRHGAMQLSQLGIEFRKYYKLPEKDRNINVSPIIKEVQQYRKCTVFYQEYVSLMSLEVKSIELAQAVQVAGTGHDKIDEIISEQTYIFEPNSYAVAAHLERSMTQIALSQLILQSKLAQYASRFRAMSGSHQLARDKEVELRLSYNNARRAVKDERLKEMINGLRKSEAAGMNTAWGQ